MYNLTEVSTFAKGAVTPTVVLVHGMWSRGSAWTPLRRRLEAAGCIVHAPTLPLHDVDPSRPPPPGLGRVSVGRYVDALARVVGQLETRPILIGHSLGGLLVQKLAERGLGSALVLLSTAPMLQANLDGLTLAALRTLSPMLMRPRGWSRPHRPSRRTARWGILNGLDEPTARAIHRDLVYESGRVLFEVAFGVLGRFSDVRVHPERIEGPVLVLCGAEDRICPVQVSRKTAALYGERASLQEMEGAGHYVLEGPALDIVAPAIVEFVKSVVRAARNGHAGPPGVERSR